MKNGIPYLCFAIAAAVVGVGVHQVYLSTTASAEQMAAAAVTSSCAQGMLTQKKPRYMGFSLDDAWSVGDLKEMLDICSDLEIARNQMAAARSAAGAG